jgi:hypothetical protein
MADEQIVTTSEKLWSEEVETVDDSKEIKTAYVFSNGRKFDWPEPLYDTE